MTGRAAIFARRAGPQRQFKMSEARSALRTVTSLLYMRPTYARMNHLLDISDIVATIRVPTLVIHRTDDKNIIVEGGRSLAKHIPGARYFEFPGDDHIPFFGDNAGDIADAIEEFLTGSGPPVAVDRVLATVLFTGILGSTEKAAALGDHRWRDLLDHHHAAIRCSLSRFHGREIKTTGDGVLATFAKCLLRVKTATWRKDRVISVLAPITGSVSTMRSR